MFVSCEFVRVLLGIELHTFDACASSNGAKWQRRRVTGAATAEFSSLHKQRSKDLDKTGCRANGEHWGQLMEGAEDKRALNCVERGKDVTAEGLVALELAEELMAYGVTAVMLKSALRGTKLQGSQRLQVAAAGAAQAGALKATRFLIEFFDVGLEQR